MALSTNLIDATTASPTAGTSVAPATSISDNTHTVVVLNPDSANTVYMNFGAAGGALSANNSVNILPQTSVSFAIGTLSQRAATGSNMIFDASAGTIDVRIFYVNGVSS